MNPILHILILLALPCNTIVIISPSFLATHHILSPRFSSLIGRQDSFNITGEAVLRDVLNYTEGVLGKVVVVRNRGHPLSIEREEESAFQFQQLGATAIVRASSVIYVPGYFPLSSDPIHS